MPTISILLLYIIYTVFLLQYIICFTTTNSWYLSSFIMYITKFPTLFFYTYIMRLKKEISKRTHLILIVYSTIVNIYILCVAIVHKDSFSVVLDGLTNVYIYVSFSCAIFILDTFFYKQFDQIDTTSSYFFRI